MVAGQSSVVGDPYGTVQFTGQATPTSARMALAMADNYRFVTTAVRNTALTADNVSTIISDVSAVPPRYGYGVVDDLLPSDLPIDGVLALPFYAAAIVVPYHLSFGPQVSSTAVADLLVLDVSTLALVFTGNITAWSSSRLPFPFHFLFRFLVRDRS